MTWLWEFVCRGFGRWRRLIAKKGNKKVGRGEGIIGNERKVVKKCSMSCPEAKSGRTIKTIKDAGI